MNQYRIFHGRQDFSQILDRMHRETRYSLAILDNRADSAFSQRLGSYENLDCPIMVLGCWSNEQAQGLSDMHSKALFIAFEEIPTTATMINVAAQCAKTPYLLVLRSDMKLTGLNIPKLISIMTSDKRPLALCPRCYSAQGDLLPTQRIPRIIGLRDVDSLAFMPVQSLCRTLYPVYGAGFYNLALFAKLKGYDEKIFDYLWRAYDLGSRAWLQAMPLYITDSFTISFDQWRAGVENLTSLGTKARVIARTLGVWRVLGRNRINYLCNARPKMLRTEVKPDLPLYKTDFYHLCASWPGPEVKEQ